MAYKGPKRSERRILASAASTLVLGALIHGAGAGAALAQAPIPTNRAPPPAADAVRDKEVEEVVVTGTFLRGTPETAVIPVEGVNLEELRDQGSPSNMDFIKNLSEIGSVVGEANRSNAFAIGAQSINLRGLSSSRTVVVFNGRRFPEQRSYAIGRFNNVAEIPNAAIGRVEVLKDGGATTYGADAVGGVVNYITRRNLDGVEVQASYRYIDGSDGDYDASITMGKVFENFNVLGVLGYLKRTELDLMERDWATQDYLMNPASWSAAGSPGAYAFQVAPNSTITPAPVYRVIQLPATVEFLGGTNALSTYTGNRQMGTTGMMRDPACDALGGFSGWSATPSAVCYMQIGQIQNLVEEQETWQFYGEANYEFSPRFRVHGEFTYYGLDIPRIPMDNGGQAPNNFPMDPARGGAPQIIAGASGSATPVYFVDGRNPAVATLLNSMTNSSGTRAFTDAQIAAITTTGRVALPASSWRPFGVGGNPLFGETDFQHNLMDTYRYTLELSGELGEFAGGKWDWEFAGTYNDYNYESRVEDILIDRLQAALNGFGGASCTGTTPGANGCQWFNPFSSAIEQNIFSGASNPYFVGTGSYAGYTSGQGLRNNTDLIDWLYVPTNYIMDSEYVIFDAILRGELDYHLWSDEKIQLAVGAQYRELHVRDDLSDLIDRDLNPCSTVASTACLAAPPQGLSSAQTRGGPLVFNRGIQATGIIEDSNRRFPIESAFGEIRVPVTDALSFQVSGRWEKFFSDLGSVDNEVFVTQGAVRWQATPWLALRATAGETFTNVDPPAPADPIAGVANLTSQLAGSTQVQYFTENHSNTEVRPETGFNYNVGLVFELGDFTATIDYYNIKLDDVARTGSAATIVQAIALPGSTGVNTLADCANPIFTEGLSVLGGQPFITPGPNGCTAGVTTVAQALQQATVRFFGTQGQQRFLVNGGTLQTSGVDVGATWRRSDFLGGDFSLSGDVSYVLEYEQGQYQLGNAIIDRGFDGVGSFNESTGRNGQHIAQFRGSIGVNFRRGRHNFNWNTRVVSSFMNDDINDFLTSNALNANIGNSTGTVTTPSSFCGTFVQSPPIPAGAGTGQYGSLGSSLTTGGFRPVGFDACQNTAVMSGTKIPATFNTDVTYRVQLPADTTLSLSVSNLFDKDPEFSRDLLNYDAYTGSPLGRTFKVTVLKKWQ